MTNNDYKLMVEEKYGRPLRDIMYELCVERHVDKWEGSKELGVPDKTFIAWRTKFRFGPDQLVVDRAKLNRKKSIEEYQQQLENVNLQRAFNFREEVSLRGFRELMERMLEFEKFRRMEMGEDSFSEMSSVMRIAAIESTLENLDKYENANLHELFYRDVDLFLKEPRCVI